MMPPWAVYQHSDLQKSQSEIPAGFFAASDSEKKS
jgi:hypothetical protein